MHSFKPSVVASRRLRSAFALAGVALLLSGAIARADDPTITYSFNVPPAPPKLDPGGWGKLILTFDKPITGGTFVFQPECGPGVGPAGTLSGNSMSIALGPGKYGLLPTGTADNNVDPVQNYGTFDVTINYAAAPPPNLIVSSSFWEFKATAQNNLDSNMMPTANSTYIMGDARDVVLPEPSTLLLGGGGLMLVGLRRRSRSSGIA